MSGDEIRARIDFNNKILEKPSTTFVLDKEKLNAINENIKLRTLCLHKFVDGKCVFCDVEEKDLK